jgi:CelD/BcsL family acetyltransferase involved in cellulose biosynthesis
MPLTVVECIPHTDKNSADLWNKALAHCESYSMFQTQRWSEILETVIPGAKPFHRWIRFSDGKEAVLPLLALPKGFGVYKLESLPWGTYGGLIGEGPFSLDHLNAAAKSLLSLLQPVLEIIIPPNADMEIENSNADIRESNTHILELTDGFDDIWSNKIKPRERTKIRNAEKKGIEISWSNSCNSVETMKRLYKSAVTRWEGVETIPLNLFDALIDLPPEEGRIWMARHDDKVIVANVILYGKGDAQYFAGARDPEFDKLNAPVFLTSEIIKDACERGYDNFNFGASSGLEGVQRFKESMGGKTRTYFKVMHRHWLLEKTGL